MKFSDQKPPNFDVIADIFPMIRGSKGIVFTYGDTLYAPNHGI